MKKSLFVAFLMLCVLCVHSFGAISYTGTLTTPVVGDQLVGTGPWAAGTTSITWTVTDNEDSTWKYEYLLTVPAADISHFIIEASPSFDYGNLLNASYPGTSYEIKTHVGSPGLGVQPNPFLPEDIYGAKFDIGDENSLNDDHKSITVSFDSDRAPIWGDFYAKCGNVGGTQNTIWNEGLLVADPLDPAANGSLLNHVLIPDTIPEPATMALLGLGGLLLRRRK